MKRWFEAPRLFRRSQSTENMLVESMCPAVEPDAKKRRSIKQSVKRLFRTVKAIFPQKGMLAEKAPDSTQETTGSAPLPFVERLGADWTVASVEARIGYLYTLANDAFERTYQSVLKTNAVPHGNPSVSNYLREIRQLQLLLASRPQPAEEAPTQYAFPELELEVPPQAARMARSATIEHLQGDQANCDQTRCEHTQRDQISTLKEPELLRHVQPRLLTDGLIHEGIENNTYLEFYKLSRLCLSDPDGDAVCREESLEDAQPAAEVRPEEVPRSRLSDALSSYTGRPLQGRLSFGDLSLFATSPAELFPGPMHKSQVNLVPRSLLEYVTPERPARTQSSEPLPRAHVSDLVRHFNLLTEQHSL